MARLLAIDVKTIVKIRIVHKTIIALWKENKWDLNLLSNYILNEKSNSLNSFQDSHKEQENNESIINREMQEATTLQIQPILHIEEFLSIEIEMSVNEQTKEESNTNLEYQ